MACILLWMQGGPSQFETFNPKPGHANGGETKAIATNVSGIQVAENFPSMAKMMGEAAIIRSMTSKEGSHPRELLAPYRLPANRKRQISVDWFDRGQRVGRPKEPVAVVRANRRAWRKFQRRRFPRRAIRSVRRAESRVRRQRIRSRQATLLAISGGCHYWIGCRSTLRAKRRTWSPITRSSTTVRPVWCLAPT